MPIQTSSIVEGATAGVVGSVLYTLLTVAREQYQVWSFKKKLATELRRSTCGSGIQGITTSVRNLTGTKFTVRQVALVADNAVLLFNATGVVSSAIPSRPHKLTPDQKARLQKGEAIEVGPPEMQFRPWKVGIGDAGFVEVQPFTSHEFLLPAELVAASTAKPLHLRFTIECKGWFGETEVLEETSNDLVPDMLSKVFDQFRGPALAELNNARRMFRLPPVGVQRTAAAAPTIAKQPTVVS